MKAVVVYQSRWGNTAAVARSIAIGLGPEACALSTDEATESAFHGAEIIVAGSPVFGYRLSPEDIGRAIASERAAGSPDLSQPTLMSWLAALPNGLLPGGHGDFAAFETGLRWSPGGVTGAIGKELERAGYRCLTKGRKFIVKGKSGPLRDGELEIARRWGAELALAADAGTAEYEAAS